ncbi:cupin [Adhaeribacter arboris]|uniref:Cupin n=1 Tax=Adhaeribacter arboris TaxID=2072846 RepID=A0A2T2YDE7_9BACT|nr:cupin domain-containing protein [Adhaeribacter arboris]PSR53532.1 cupin [Adhaeribacter arboris]
MTTLPTTSLNLKTTTPSFLAQLGLLVICYPAGGYLLWKSNTKLWKKAIAFTLTLPIFLLLFSYFGILLFASFLPDLDTSPVNRPDRTITNTMGDYTVTFLKTNLETKGAYELVKVNLAPKGGNDWHYHKAFVEKFHVLEGELKIGMEGNELTLRAGQRAEAPAEAMHKFYNTSSKPVIFTVEINPGRSFEKTLRIGYGLGNTGQSDKDGMPNNPWHLLLLLGYSESFLPILPGFIQEPLFPALAKIAQWKGEGKALEKFYK